MKDTNRGRLIMLGWRLKNLAWLVDSPCLKEEIRIVAKEIAQVLDDEQEDNHAENDRS